MVGDARAYHAWVDEMIATYPRLFPAGIQQGYTLHDRRTSQKLPGVQLRRIALKTSAGAEKEVTYTICPPGVLPYRVGYTDEVEKALFMR